MTTDNTAPVFGSPRRVGSVSQFDTEEEAHAFADAAALTVKQSVDVRVIRDPDTNQFVVIQTMTYLERPGDHSYVL